MKTSLTPTEKEELIEKLAQKWADDMDMDSLLEFFYDKQVEYLNDMDDEELLEVAEENDMDEDDEED